MNANFLHGNKSGTTSYWWEGGGGGFDTNVTIPWQN